MPSGRGGRRGQRAGRPALQHRRDVLRRGPHRCERLNARKPGNPQLVTVQNSVIRGSITESTCTTGSATVLGAAVFNNRPLLMRNVNVSHNVGRAEARPVQPTTGVCGTELTSSGRPWS
jgi:hypothetical protein